MDITSHASFYRVDKTSHTDMTGWTKHPTSFCQGGQNIPHQFARVDKTSHTIFHYKTNMEIIRNNKGHQKRCYEGHSYTKKRSTKSTIHWICSEKTASDCDGALITDLAVMTVSSTKQHSHAADHFKIEALKVRSEIKASVEAYRGQPGQIVTDKLAKCDVQVRAAIGNRDSLKKMVQRQRRGNTPANPSTISEIPSPLPEEYTKLGEQTFLIYDNQLVCDRVLVFATDIGLSLLSDADIWFMDGTHSTAPKQFSQLFIIRVPLGNTHVTAVYALLPSKLESAYEECLTAVLDSCLQQNLRPAPSTVVADYEMAIHNAVRSTISQNIQIQGCFYHLTQNTWRKVQAAWLQAQYSDDDTIRTFCGKLDGLAFLPLDLVSEGMDIFKEEVPEQLTDVLTYFDSTYVTGSYRSVLGSGGVLRFRRTPPRFPPPTWNVHGATMNDGHRTNNVCESWNNGYKHLVGHKHPSIWTAIDCMKKDSAIVETDHLQYNHGIQPAKRQRKKAVNHQKRLKTLGTHLIEGKKSVNEFLCAIGECIRLQ